MPSATIFEIGAADRARRADLGDRRRQLAEVEEQDARAAPARMRRSAASSVSVDGQLVIQLQLADDPLDAVERRLIVQDGEDALALGLERSRGTRRFHSLGSGSCSATGGAPAPPVSPPPPPPVDAAKGEAVGVGGGLTLSVI